MKQSENYKEFDTQNSKAKEHFDQKSFKSKVATILSPKQDNYTKSLSEAVKNAEQLFAKDKDLAKTVKSDVKKDLLGQKLDGANLLKKNANYEANLNNLSPSNGGTKPESKETSR